MQDKMNPSTKLIKSSWFIPSLRKGVLLIFLLIIILGLSSIDRIRGFNNLSSYAVWIIWWPSLMIIAFLSIRLWCMVCPLRFVSEVYGKYGLEIKIPKTIDRNKTLIAALLFLVLHSVVTSLSPNRLPITTAIYLLILLQYTAVAALIFEKNSFCRIFCPLGGMLNVFNRLGMVRFGRVDKEKCQQCFSKTCGKDCPIHLVPQELPNNSCILCTDCIQHCEKNNIGFLRTNPLGLREMSMNRGEILSVIILLGIALSEFAERLKEMAATSGNWNLLLGKIINYVPGKLLPTSANSSLAKLLYITWDYLVFPLALTLILVMICKIFFYRRSFRDHLINLSTSMIPFIFGVFLMILLNYPLSLFYTGPSSVRKAILLVFLVLGLLTSLYVFIRNLMGERPTAKYDKSLPI
ncbi:MAG: 4Fe-4S binding protein [Peptococcaceae bacterium]|nr:4Fe-4S binding protein [Peptococcaceae bacterium]